VAAGLVVAFRSLGIGNLNPPTRYEKILHNVGEMLSQIHFSPKKIDDTFSKEIFGKFLHSDKVDPSKNIFLASDVQELKKFETTIDEEIKGGSVNFVPAAYALYNKRLLELNRFIRISCRNHLILRRMSLSILMLTKSIFLKMMQT
jgi:carboxyl-terminal processing protease